MLEYWIPVALWCAHCSKAAEKKIFQFTSCTSNRMPCSWAVSQWNDKTTWNRLTVPLQNSRSHLGQRGGQIYGCLINRCFLALQVLLDKRRYEPPSFLSHCHVYGGWGSSHQVNSRNSVMFLLHGLAIDMNGEDFWLWTHSYQMPANVVICTNL